MALKARHSAKYSATLVRLCKENTDLVPLLSTIRTEPSIDSNLSSPRKSYSTSFDVLLDRAFAGICISHILPVFQLRHTARALYWNFSLQKDISVSMHNEAHGSLRLRRNEYPFVLQEIIYKRCKIQLPFFSAPILSPTIYHLDNYLQPRYRCR